MTNIDTALAAAAPETIKTFALLKFYVRDDDPNQEPLIPRTIAANLRGPKNVPSKHDEKLRALGLGDLAKRGRKRPGKRDTGEQIELPNFANFTTRSFFDSMKEHHLNVVSIGRKVDQIAAKVDKKGAVVRQAHNRHVITIGIGWGASVEMSPEVQDELMVLMRGNWASSYVWDNNNLRMVGIPTVDTINLSNPAFVIKSENELLLDTEANLQLMPIGDAHLTVRTPHDQMPPVVAET